MIACKIRSTSVVLSNQVTRPVVSTLLKCECAFAVAAALAQHCFYLDKVNRQTVSAHRKKMIQFGILDKKF